MASWVSRLSAFGLVCQSVSASPVTLESWKRHEKEAGSRGAVASESRLCTQIGSGLLRMGGNAADAMVGTAVCIGTVAMYHSGIGGGGFMNVRSPNGSYEFIDFRETAPAAAFKDMYKNDEPASRVGGLASGVPGDLKGLEYLHQKYGALDWTTVLKPAVQLARNGWKVDEDLVSYMNSAIATAKENATSNFLVNDLEFALDFAPQGRLLKLNETISRKRYADTLEVVSQQGADAFYQGPIAEATIRALQAKGGIMTLQDLKNYTVALRKPFSITYRGYKITSTSAPSGGPVVLSILKTMEGYANVGDPANINLTTHRLDEAMKFAYGQRAELGDPSFVDTVDQLQESMVSEETAELIRSKISDTQTFDTAYYQTNSSKGLEQLATPGTSHIVTADYTGLSVSLTTTVNLLFGSKLVVPETGVIMNNEMNDFSIPDTTNAFGYVPNPNNFVSPGKRPLSSISPVIIERLGCAVSNAFYAAVGAAGGSRIPTATLQTILHILDGGMSVAEALAEPRIHDQLQPEQVSFEYAFNNGTTAFLKSLGKNVTWVAPGQSSAQGLRRHENGTFEAAGEPRQKHSAGYVV